MPLSVRRPGRLCRVTAIAAVLALSLASCTTDDGAESPAVDGAAVMGAAAALPGKYVSPNGDNSNPGTSPDRPFRTVAYAVKQLNPGDTLYVMEGEFFENERGDSAVVVSRSGTPDAWITITAQPGATPILRSNQSNGIKVEGASYIEVSNLELVGNPTGGTSSYSGAGINVDSIYGPAKNHHVRVLNNRISGFGAGGIPVTGSSHVEIRNNVIHNVAEVEPSQHSGISILESFNMGFGNDSNGYSNYITGNVVYQVENKNRDHLGRFTDGNCIIMDRTNINNYSGRTLIANNLCLDNGGRGIQIYESKHVDVVNNTIYKNLKTPEIASSGGELGAFYSSDIEFANNLVFSRNGLKPARTFDSSNIRFVKNLYVADTAPEYNGASNDDRRVAPGTPVATGPSTNPNPANFELQSGSPAIDAGTNKFNTVMAKDVVGAARVAGGAIDLGALESSSSAPTPTTTPPTTAKPATTKPPTTQPPTTTPATSKPSTTTGGADGSTSSTSTESGESAPPTTSSTAVSRPPTTVGAASDETESQSISTTSDPDTGGSSGTDPTVVGSSTSTSVPALQSDSGVSAAAASVPTTENTATFDSENELDGSDFDDFADGTPGGSVIEAAVVTPSQGPAAGAPTVFSNGEPSPADGARDRNLSFEAPGTLAFDDSPAPQAPIPVEIPLAAVVALTLLASYYRPRWTEQELG